MNKWLVRILGVMILLVFCLIVFDKWFNPKVPQQLDVSGGQEIELPLPNNAQGSDDQVINNVAPEETLILTSNANNNTVSEPVNTEPQPALVNTEVSQNVAPVTPNTPQLTVNPPAEQKIQNAPQAVANPQPAVSNTSANSWLQAGAFASQQNAKSRLDTIQQNKLVGQIEKGKSNGKDIYRVYVGPLSTSQLSNAQQVLGKLGIQYSNVTR